MNTLEAYQREKFSKMMKILDEIFAEHPGKDELDKLLAFLKAMREHDGLCRKDIVLRLIESIARERALREVI